VRFDIPNFRNLANTTYSNKNSYDNWCVSNGGNCIFKNTDADINTNAQIVTTSFESITINVREIE
jgi:hypothetical protein